MSRRLWIGAALTVPVVALEDAAASRASTLNWLQFVLATPVVLWAGCPFFQRGWDSLVRRSLNMFTLIALGTGAAWLYSVVATLAPGLFPAGFRAADGSVAVYFEAAAVITVLVLLGQVLELRAREQTGGAIRALLNLAPKTARRITAGGDDEEIPLDRIQPGDRLRVRPGDGVPVDGVVLRGQQRRRRIDGHRRVDAGGQARRRPRDRRHGQRHRRLRHARRPRGAGDHARPHRRHGRRGAALARADPAPRRRRGRLVRAGGDRGRAGGIRRLGDVGTAPCPRLRADRRRFGAHHRLPLRARPCDADVDHGRRRQGRRRRRADPLGRGAGAAGEGGYARPRQDRHADRGQAARDRGGAGGRWSETRSAGSLPPRSNAPASIRWPPPSSPRRRSAGSPSPSQEAFVRSPARASAARWTAGRRAGQCRPDARPAASRSAIWKPRPMRCGATAPPRSILAIDGQARRRHRHRRSDQADGAGCAAPPARPGTADRHADRRQPRPPPRPSRAAWTSARSWPRCCRTTSTR